MTSACPRTTTTGCLTRIPADSRTALADAWPAEGRQARRPSAQPRGQPLAVAAGRRSAVTVSASAPGSVSTRTVSPSTI